MSKDIGLLSGLPNCALNILLTVLRSRRTPSQCRSGHRALPASKTQAHKVNSNPGIEALQDLVKFCL